MDVTAKVANQVTAVRFEEGQQVRRGDVLVELDGAQARADLAVAEAALAESRSQYQRSRELYTTKVLSDAQIEQIEATFKANEARVASARSRLDDTVIRAPFAGRVGLRRVSVGVADQPRHGDHDARRHQLDQARFHDSRDLRVGRADRAQDRARAAFAYPDESFEGTVSSIDTRVDPGNALGHRARASCRTRRGCCKPGMFLTVRLSRGAWTR